MNNQVKKYCFVFGYGDVYGDVCFVEGSLSEIVGCLDEEELEFWGNMDQEDVSVLFDGDGYNNDWEKEFTNSEGYKLGNFKIVKYGSVKGMNGFGERFKSEVRGKLEENEELRKEEELNDEE